MQTEGSGWARTRSEGNGSEGTRRRREARERRGRGPSPASPRMPHGRDLRRAAAPRVRRSSGPRPGRSCATRFPTPIEHVVVILQENHSFDNVLGQLCIQEKRECNAASTGTNKKGETIPLTKASDVVPTVSHNQESQLKAIDKGKMDGWEKVGGCQARQCYTAFEPSQIPSLAALAHVGRDLRRLLLARHRPLLGRPPRLLRADARRLRRQQPDARERRAAGRTRAGGATRTSTRNGSTRSPMKR